MTRKEREELEAKFSRIMGRVNECPNCREECNVLDEFCHCGARNDNHQPELLALALPIVERLKSDSTFSTCKQCKDKKVSALARYCTSCGAPNPKFEEKLFIYILGPVSAFVAHCEAGHPNRGKEPVLFDQGTYCAICGKPFFVS